MSESGNLSCCQLKISHVHSLRYESLILEWPGIWWILLILLLEVRAVNVSRRPLLRIGVSCSRTSVMFIREFTLFPEVHFDTSSESVGIDCSCTKCLICQIDLVISCSYTVNKFEVVFIPNVINVD